MGQLETKESRRFSSSLKGTQELRLADTLVASFQVQRIIKTSVEVQVVRQENLFLT